MAIFMMEIGKTTREMDMEYGLIAMVINMKENGKMMSAGAKVIL